MFERFEKVIGKEKVDAIKSKKVMVIGIGGVGGYAVEGLVRSGIANIILIDSDIVEVTNKNRQIIALDSTINQKKVEAMKSRITDINSECVISSLDIFLDSSNTRRVIEEYKPDYIIDACDTINTKKEIITAALDLNIKLITSMGTGNKLDPSKLEITDIRKTSYDPIAKILRKWLKEEKINKKIMTLWSPEKPIKTEGRIPGSTCFVPGCAGLMMASYVINDIINDENK